MKKWIESWLIPFVNKYADTKVKRRVAWSIMLVIGIVISWFGFTVTQVSTEQLFILGKTPLGQGVLK